ncbi:MAG: methyltransferase domain-containing protein [Nanoarchaeota archaeon]|nr:methyltransferase domain-containing protein [Nanoarchaeota archaeon]MBU1704412.1 methyltransferase domain-containing protein [Nanoarchaeota archaeon]
MAKILISKESKYYVKDPSKDYHSKEGQIKAADMQKDHAVSNIGKDFSVFDSWFIDDYSRIKRGAQIVARKEIGLIISETGINKNSVAVDAGGGSGALSCFLAHICKEVTTYEIREDFFKTVEANKEMLGLKNLTVKNADVTKGIDEKNVDLITLDLPAPWEAIASAHQALKAGGFLINYSPTIPQVMDFVSNLPEDIIHLKTIEIIEREWEVDGRKVRPKTRQLGHTGFLTFCRKI